MSRSTLAAILVGGLIAASIDLWAAVLISGKPMVFILQFIASGLIGKEAAFAGGMKTAVLGLALQELMGLIIAAIYVLTSRRLPVLRRQWLPLGLAYGVPVYFVMNYVVMPLSKVGRSPTFAVEPFLKNMAAMLLFGLIVAAAARWRMGKS